MSPLKVLYKIKIANLLGIFCLKVATAVLLDRMEKKKDIKSQACISMRVYYFSVFLIKVNMIKEEPQRACTHIKGKNDGGKWALFTPVKSKHESSQSKSHINMSHVL